MYYLRSGTIRSVHASPVIPTEGVPLDDARLEVARVEVVVLHRLRSHPLLVDQTLTAHSRVRDQEPRAGRSEVDALDDLRNRARVLQGVDVVVRRLRLVRRLQDPRCRV